MLAEKYGNVDGRSPVDSYEEGEDFIRIEFNTGRIYLYDFETSGEEAVKEMQKLARSGRGLVSYINQHKPTFADREK